MTRFNGLLRVWLCVCLAVLIAGCESDRAIEPTLPPAGPDLGGVAAMQAVAADLIALVGWELAEDAAMPDLAGIAGKPCGVQLRGFDREVLVEDIVHYSIQVQVGPEPFGVIGLHRVVRESQAWRPIRAGESLFMLHGSGVGFVPAFLPTARLDYMPPDHNLPVFLARHDVDVWGIDMAWTFIPGDITDFEFAAGWGVQREIDDLRTGIALARLVRLLTGNGWRPMDLLGWSTGAELGYIYLNEESQLPPKHQQVAGYIPVDGLIKSDAEPIISDACASYLAIQATRETGVYVNDIGTLAQYASYLAATDPAGDSPIVPGYTNLQFVLAAVAQTNQVLGGNPPSFHLLAGMFDVSGLPTGLQFVDTRFAVDFYAAWAPYSPNLIDQEIAALKCGAPDLSFDDHLANIEVPILNVAPGGGMGSLGSYMQNVVGSQDFQSLIISVNPDPYLDLGHVDIFAAYLGVDVAGVVWQPILEWMQGHGPIRCDPTPGVALVE